VKVAIIHDYLNQYGGGEKVVEALHEVWPEAPIYTSIYERQKMQSFGFKSEGAKIRTSYMQHLPLREVLPRYYFTIFYPLAFQSFDLKGYDVIVSSSSYAAKDIRKPSGAIHISYIHTPPRFLYGYDQETNTAAMNPVEKGLAKLWKVYLRHRDQEAVRRIDYLIANSKTVQERIKKVYGRQSTVIYPPVDTAFFEGEALDKGYFLIVSRLGEYKRVDLVVKAFNEIGWPLKVVGSGPQLKYIKEIAKPNIEILGRLPDQEVRDLLLGCSAFVFPTEEDFGIAPVEAMAAGKPVLAYGAGGATETIVAGKTGEFFAEQNVKSLVAALKGFDAKRYKVEDCRNRAKEFDREIFKKKIADFVDRAVSGKISKGD
jgi:glycosyltransferase involved in cell wall biosynthesis